MIESPILWNDPPLVQLGFSFQPRLSEESKGSSKVQNGVVYQDGFPLNDKTCLFERWRICLAISDWTKSKWKVPYIPDSEIVLQLNFFFFWNVFQKGFFDHIPQHQVSVRHEGVLNSIFYVKNKTWEKKIFLWWSTGSIHANNHTLALSIHNASFILVLCLIHKRQINSIVFQAQWKITPKSSVAITLDTLTDGCGW